MMSKIMISYCMISQRNHQDKAKGIMRREKRRLRKIRKSLSLIQ
jgi:hypothetical protein